MHEYNFDYFQFKKRIKKPIKFNYIFFSLSLIFLLAICVILKQSDNKKCVYYFVQIDEVDTFSQANKMATELWSCSAAGFVYFDKNYHILAGYYPDKSNAKSVVENIKDDYPNAKVISVFANEFNSKKLFSKAKKSALKNIIASNKKLINSLYQISISVDKNEVGFNTSIQKINTLKEDFLISAKQFENAFDDDKLSFNLIKKLEKISNSLTNLTSTNEQELKQKIKYELINIVILNSMIQNEIG